MAASISTLDRLYAWKSKLCDEVKVSSAICRRYNERCKKLRHQESRLCSLELISQNFTTSQQYFSLTTNQQQHQPFLWPAEQSPSGGNQIDIDFTHASVKDLHSRVLVVVHKIGFISKNIEGVRDKYLQPQLEELVGCFTRMWATMVECHQCQCAIIKLMSRSCDLKILFQSESQRQARFLLSVELRKMCSNFQNSMASQKAYRCSLNMWLYKCMKPLKRRKVSRNRNAIDDSLTKTDVMPIFTTCEMWIKLLDDLPTTDLEEAIEGLIADISHSIPHKEKVANDEIGGASHSPIDLHPSLLRFIEKLEALSETSVEKYIDLQENVRAAKERMWRRKD